VTEVGADRPGDESDRVYEERLQRPDTGLLEVQLREDQPGDVL